MRFRSLQLERYSGFKALGRMILGPGINFVVGKNNTGKSALLKGLRSINQTTSIAISTPISLKIYDDKQTVEITLAPRELGRICNAMGGA